MALTASALSPRRRARPIVQPRGRDAPRRPGRGVPGRHGYGVAIFYLVFIAVLFIEGAIIHTFGLWVGGGIFLFGGAALGVLELRFINPDRALRDPILRLGCWLHTRWGALGYLINALITGGAPGVAVALKKTNHPWKLWLTLLAAVLFAVAWASFWHFVWP